MRALCISSHTSLSVGFDVVRQCVGKGAEPAFDFRQSPCTRCLERLIQTLGKRVIRAGVRDDRTPAHLLSDILGYVATRSVRLMRPPFGISVLEPKRMRSTP